MEAAGRRLSGSRAGFLKQLLAAAWPAAAEWAAIAAALDFLFYRKPAMMLLLLPAGIFYIRLRNEGKRRARERALTAQFRSFLRSLEVSLRAGFSPARGFREAAHDLEAQYGEKAELVRELSKVNAKAALKVPVEKAFSEYAEGCGVEDIRDFAAVFSQACRMGGQMTSIIGSCARTIGGKLDVEAEIESTVAAKKYEQAIMSVMPCGILAYLNLVSPGFLDVMYTTELGTAVMTLCLVCYGGAVVWGRKMAEVEV